jgi:hypothetical protein
MLDCLTPERSIQRSREEEGESDIVISDNIKGIAWNGRGAVEREVMS